ncbi:MAG: hypothetical protein WHT07_11825 [Desulfobaccales bacterium]
MTPIAGFIICIIWFLLIKRGMDYEKYWVYSARELEEKYFNNSIRVLSRGGSYLDGDEIIIELKDSKKNKISDVT